MKKLMVAFVAVTMAAAANAGCYVWGFGSGEDEGSDGGYALADATAMLFIGSIGETWNAEQSGYVLDFSSATQVGNGATQDPNNYTYGVLEFDSTVTSDAVNTSKSQAYTLILFEDAVTDYTKYEGQYAIVTGNSVLAEDPSSSTPYSDFTTVTALSASDYKTAVQPVPEPTSGLLLLLGMAGLALRRRRA